MIRASEILIAAVMLMPNLARPEQAERFDYWQPQRAMIRYGQQALMMCNGLFTSHRTLEQVFAQELAFLPQPVGTPAGGDYAVDRARRTVAVGAASGDTPVMRAAFRDGVGCVMLAPDQGFGTIDELPSLEMPSPPGDPAKTAWPDGDLVADAPPPPDIDAEALAGRPTGPSTASRPNR